MSTRDWRRWKCASYPSIGFLSGARSDASFYKWRAKYGGMDASMIAEKKALEDENRRLKRMFADLAMQNELLKEALGKK
jgi:hypothetical protein